MPAQSRCLCASQARQFLYSSCHIITDSVLPRSFSIRRQHRTSIAAFCFRSVLPWVWVSMLSIEYTSNKTSKQCFLIVIGVESFLLLLLNSTFDWLIRPLNPLLLRLSYVIALPNCPNVSTASNRSPSSNIWALTSTVFISKTFIFVLFFLHYIRRCLPLFLEHPLVSFRPLPEQKL